MASDRMPFTSHLGELRNKILVAFIAVLLGFMTAFNFSEHIFSMLVLPMHSGISFKGVHPYIYFVPREGAVQELVFLAPAEAFWVHMKIALITGFIAAAPIIFWQVWNFISPGLVKKEKRLAIPFVLITSGLFFFGAIFCFIIVLPFAMNFLLNFRTESLTPMLSAERYIDFCLKFILAFGAVFELPVVIVFLTRTGVISTETLAKNRKYAVLMAFVVAALLTPTPDAFNQTLMAVPIIILYEGGLIASRILMRKKRKEGEEDKEKADGEGSGGEET